MKLVLIPVACVFALSLTACQRPEASPGRGPSDPAAPASAPPASAGPTLAPSLPPTTAAVSLPGPGRSPSPAAGTAPTAPPSTATPARPTDAKLEIRRLVLASRVVAREPELALAPRVNEPLLAFVEAKNGKTEEERLIVTFEHESGKKVGFVELSVPGGTSRYRTWARTHNLSEAGNWAAVVRNEGGTELGRTAFIVTKS